MRIFLRTLLLFALISPASGFAQFQAPTDEELRVTSGPKRQVATPQEAKPMCENRALLTATVTATPAEVTVTGKLQRCFALVKPEDYPGLRNFYQKVAAIDQQQIILTHTTNAKGN